MRMKLCNWPCGGETLPVAARDVSDGQKDSFHYFTASGDKNVRTTESEMN